MSGWFGGSVDADLVWWSGYEGFCKIVQYKALVSAAIFKGGPSEFPKKFSDTGFCFCLVIP